MNDVTHLGFQDIPMLSNIPNLVYLAPTTKEEYIVMTYLKPALQRISHLPESCKYAAPIFFANRVADSMMFFLISVLVL